MKKFLSIVLSLTLMFSTLVSFNSMTFAASKPAATSITSLTGGNKCITVKWNKKSVDGYQIMYSTSSDFDSSKKVNVKKGSATSKKISDLKNNKKYYVKIRSYKTDGDSKKYSSWSKYKSVKTKAKSSGKSSSKKSGNTVYITPTGKKYHYDKDCAGKNAIKTDLKSAKKNYEPCKKCANG